MVSIKTDEIGKRAFSWYQGKPTLRCVYSFHGWVRVQQGNWVLGSWLINTDQSTAKGPVVSSGVRGVGPFEFDRLGADTAPSLNTSFLSPQIWIVCFQWWNPPPQRGDVQISGGNRQAKTCQALTKFFITQKPRHPSFVWRTIWKPKGNAAKTITPMGHGTLATRGKNKSLQGMERERGFGISFLKRLKYKKFGNKNFSNPFLAITYVRFRIRRLAESLGRRSPGNLLIPRGDFEGDTRRAGWKISAGDVRWLAVKKNHISASRAQENWASFHHSVCVHSEEFINNLTGLLLGMFKVAAGWTSGAEQFPCLRTDTIRNQWSNQHEKCASKKMISSECKIPTG